MVVARYLPNPRGLVRASDLTGPEAVRLYEAISFALEHYGHAGIMNVHLVILWTSLGIHSHRRALHLLGVFLNRARKWAAVGLPEQPRRRRRARSGSGFTLRYVFVCECNHSAGFHSHVLCHLPHAVLPEFKAWARCSLRQLAQHYGDETTIKIVASRERSEAVRCSGVGVGCAIC